MSFLSRIDQLQLHNQPQIPLCHLCFQRFRNVLAIFWGYVPELGWNFLFSIMLGLTEHSPKGLDSEDVLVEFVIVFNA